MIRSFALALAAAAGLAGCSPVPNDGPLLHQVVSKHEAKDDFFYSLVNLDARAVSALSRYGARPFSRSFGLPRRRGGAALGVGDTLEVTIFEAGPDGIFSTQERKSVTVPLTVQSNGRISVPFAGSVRASGRTVGQVRQAIIGALRGRAVEPDVIVETGTLRSRTAVVNGEVGSPQPVPLVLGNERVLDVLAQAGGPRREPYNTYISLSRGGTTRTALLQQLIRQPRENIFVRPGDSLYVTYEPCRFVALGAVAQAGRYEFGSRDVDLLEATAMAGGFEEARSNPKAYFVFRYEYEHTLRHLHSKHVIDDATLHRAVENRHLRDHRGRLPVVYRIDLSDPDNFFVAKRFFLRADDAIYVARKVTVDFARVVQLLAQARLATSLVTTVQNLGN